MYSDKVLDHFHHPRNVGEIADATKVIDVVNPACGDSMKLWVVVRDGRIAEAKFKTAGCVPAVACGSWLTETITGKGLDELTLLTPERIESEMGGLPTASRHAAALAAEVAEKLVRTQSQECS